MFDQDFPKADVGTRGCGERVPGGVYAECGLSRGGRPLEEFLIDPPLPIPAGLDLINKTQLWQRRLSTGEPVLDGEDHPVFDLLMWVGAEHYEYCCDYIEEVMRYGASRRLNPNLDLSLLSASSRMILAHPYALNTRWEEQRPPLACKKEVPGHDVPDVAAEDEAEASMGRSGEESITDSSVHFVGNDAGALHPKELPLAETARRGPCLFKLWELIPQEAAQTVIDVLDSEVGESRPGAERLPLCLRVIGSTIYQYRPTGESADGLIPGIFAVLPITGIALIRYDDGSVNERARAKMLAGQEARGNHHALPHYESDR